MKNLTGKVVSTKMTKSAVVEVTSITRHPIYQKRIKKTKRFLAHNELGAALGDQVLLQETRPISRLKRWIIKEIITK